MRVNVYTEELKSVIHPISQIVTAKYISSRTGKEMTNYGLRIFMRSAPELHFIPGRDDDRSSVTFWCGGNREDVFRFWKSIMPNELISDLNAAPGDDVSPL